MSFLRLLSILFHDIITSLQCLRPVLQVFKFLQSFFFFLLKLLIGELKLAIFHLNFFSALDVVFLNFQFLRQLNGFPPLIVVVLGNLRKSIPKVFSFFVALFQLLPQSVDFLFSGQKLHLKSDYKVRPLQHFSILQLAMLCRTFHNFLSAGVRLHEHSLGVKITPL